MNENKQVPAAALRCVSGPFALGDNGESAKTAPFNMVARSGDSIDHWYWGKVVHDLQGMRLDGSKVAIDYIHDENQIIGYANHFSAESGDLEVSGALTPYKENDRASEIVYKARQGVPYQASINFAGDGIVIEEFGEGETAEANGRKFSGPVTVIRDWPLRGVAVCPYGADSGTSTEFSSSDTQEVKVMSHDEKELTEAVLDEVETTEADAAAVEAEVDNEDTAADATEAVEAVEVAEQPESTPEAEPAALKTGPDYLERFGDLGGVWFAQGKSWDQCVVLHEEALQEKISDLEAKLSARSEGEAEPVEFSAADDEVSPKRMGLQHKIKQMMDNK